MTLQRALEIAFEAHKDQKDKTGLPYLLHVMSVMNKGRNEKEKIVGVLHDLVEDTDWKFEDLEREGFSEEIISALKCLTHGEGEPYEDYILRAKSNPLAT